MKTHVREIVENGRVVASGPAAELAARADIKGIYLGAAAPVRRRSRH